MKWKRVLQTKTDRTTAGRLARVFNDIGCSDERHLRIEAGKEAERVMVFTCEQLTVVFEEAEKRIEFEAATDTGFVLGSAVKLPYDLVTGYYSVHTTADALRLGESNIAVIGRRLHNQGVLGPKAKMTARREGARR